MVRAFFSGSFLDEDPLVVERMPLKKVLSMRESAPVRGVFCSDP